MPRGNLEKTNVEWKIYQLIGQLDEAHYAYPDKELAKQYLHWLLDYCKEFSN